jgi:hypothetical protein
MTDLRRYIAELLEEDSYGLWEIAWYLKDKLEIPKDDAVDIFKKILLEMLRNNEAVILKEYINGSQEIVEKPRHEELIEDSANWNEPQPKTKYNYRLAKSDRAERISN